ncbi:MAG: lactate racemase domain-containing protein [Anaerolineaceae bacterium]|nr:lactate racemase domain-containing protein [Anaerolineaceae bacterium]
MTIGLGFQDQYLDTNAVERVVEEALSGLALDGKRVLFLIPDGTRSMPMPLMFDLFEKHLSGRVAALDYLVALGTHQPMSDEQLSQHIGRKVKGGKAGESHIFNHAWEKPETFVQIGVIPAEEIESISEGRLVEDVSVRLNRLILDYDQIIICGPVFPHEVVGFSGGNKYFFPGIAGAEIINFTHWLGALITSYEIIGAGYTPVRAVIDRAASFITKPVSCFTLVVTHEGLSGIFFGEAREAWEAAAALSARKHIVYVEKPFEKVISIMPELYDDLWTAAKGMYKMEPVIADGGEVIIYAPNITEVSYTHGKYLDKIGYHCRDYFTKQWSKFQNYPHGVIAHSTHLRGMGTYDEASGEEQLRIKVTLATGIPRERCEKIGLGYLDPATFNPQDWVGKEEQGILVVPRAGEMLYRLKVNASFTYKEK